MLYARIEACYRSILDFYINPEYLEKTDIASVQYRDPKNFMALKDVYLGGKVSVALAKEDCKLSQEEIRAFRTHCLNFLVESAHQIYKRFPFQKCGAIKHLSDIAPKSVLSKQVGSLAPSSESSQTCSTKHIQRARQGVASPSKHRSYRSSRRSARVLALRWELQEGR
ncbi:unnamed protein product [Ixodes hexagonus]